MPRSTRRFWYVVLYVAVVSNTFLIGLKIENHELMLNVIAIGLAAFVIGMLRREK